jgi:5-deoxy-D-glucuronate isomerase
MTLLKRRERKPGYCRLAGGEGSSLKLLELGILTLKKGERYEGDTADREMAVILRGSATSRAACCANIGRRKTVFAGRHSARTCPSARRSPVACLPTTEIALCFSAPTRRCSRIVVKDTDVTVGGGGVLNWRRRCTASSTSG